VWTTDDRQSTAIPISCPAALRTGNFWWYYKYLDQELHAIAMAYIECARGRGSGRGYPRRGDESPRSWSFFVNECLKFDVLEEKK